MRRLIGDPLGHVLLAVALLFAGCDTSPPPGLRACPMCGHGMEWSGRCWRCGLCQGPIP